MMRLFTMVVVLNAARMLAAHQTGQMYIGWVPPRQFKIITKAGDPQLWRNNWISSAGISAAWFILIAYQIFSD